MSANVFELCALYMWTCVRVQAEVAVRVHMIHFYHNECCQGVSYAVVCA